jgi:WD40 repeat protein
MKEPFTFNDLPPGLKLQHILRGNRLGEAANSVAWSSGEQILASSYGSTVRLWDTEKGKLLPLNDKLSQPRDYVVQRLAWSPCEKKLAVGGTTTSTIIVQVWDISNQPTADQPTASFSAPIDTSSWRSSWMGKLEWSPNGRFLAATYAFDETIWVWDLQTKEARIPLKGGMAPFAFSAQRQWLAGRAPDTGGRKQPTVQVWDYQTGKFEKSCTFERAYSPLTSLVWSPDGHYLASATAREHEIQVWSIREKKLWCLFPNWPDDDLAWSDVNALAWSPNGGFLASGAVNGTVHVWDLIRNDRLATLKAAHSGEVNSLAWLSEAGWLSDHAMVASVSGRYISIWSNKSGDPLLVLPALDGLDSLPWHSRRHLLVTPGHRSEDLFVWELDLPLLSQQVPKTFSMAVEKVSEPEKPASINLYISCASAPDDQKLRQELEKQLSVLKRQGRIKIRSTNDNDILAGSDREMENETHRNAAHIILLLISPDFMHDDYCYDTEMKHALEREAKGEAYVIPLLIRHMADWETAGWGATLLGQLTLLSPDEEPLHSRSDREKAMSIVAQHIGHLVKKLKSGFPSSPWRKEYMSNLSVSLPQMNTLRLPSRSLEKTSMRIMRESKEWRKTIIKHIFWSFFVFFFLVTAFPFWRFLSRSVSDFILGTLVVGTLVSVVYAFVRADRNAPKEAKYRDAKIRVKVGHGRYDRRGEFTLLRSGFEPETIVSRWTEEQDVLDEAKQYVDMDRLSVLF